MNLLDAVNLMLEAVGEHPVSSPDIRHPTVAKARQILTQSRRQLLADSYWFNTVVRKLMPDFRGEITLPAEVLSVLPTSHLQVTLRGGKLYDLAEDSFKFPGLVEAEVTLDLEFEDLPMTARYAVANRSAIVLYGSDIGLDNNAAVYEQNANAALVQLGAEHVRQQKYSARHRRSWRALQYARRG